MKGVGYQFMEYLQKKIKWIVLHPYQLILQSWLEEACGRRGNIDMRKNMRKRQEYPEQNRKSWNKGLNRREGTECCLRCSDFFNIYTDQTMDVDLSSNPLKKHKTSIQIVRRILWGWQWGLYWNFKLSPTNCDLSSNPLKKQKMIRWSTEEA